MQTEGLIKVANCDKAGRVGDVIFVHGLDGDARTTWLRGGNANTFWPAWLGEDLPNVGVWSLGYAVSSTAWKGKTMPLADRATNILDRLELDGIGLLPIVFVCHSLGGLLVKQLLRHAHDYGNPKYKRIAEQTKGIIYLSTPHSGADLASWLKHVGSIIGASVSMEELEAHHSRLRELNIWYRNHPELARIATVVYCEKQKVAGLFLVVNETTADPGIAGVVPIPVDEDHISICKPGSKDHQIYRRSKKVIEEVFFPPF